MNSVIQGLSVSQSTMKNVLSGQVQKPVPHKTIMQLTKASMGNWVKFLVVLDDQHFEAITFEKRKAGIRLAMHILHTETIVL